MESQVPGGVARKRLNRRVAVLVDTSTGWGRRLISGIVAYGRTHGPWHLWIEPHGQHETLRPPKDWSGDGIIARVSTVTMARQLRTLSVPVVNISGILLPGKHFPTVASDLLAAGRLAAQHFLDRGFKSFAYCGILRFPYVAQQYQGFASLAKEAGYPCEAYKPAAGEQGWTGQLSAIGRWLKQLPKPVGILTWARTASILIEACHLARLNVPEEVAVLDGDEDDLLNEATMPPISGIAMPSEQIGQQASAMLDALMQGRTPDITHVLLPPTQVMTRQSTDTLAMEDAELAEAIRFIRASAGQAIGVQDVVRATAISRRSLERRFEQVLGRSPAEEIRRVHMERAKQLLMETDMPIPKVAAASGFGSAEYMAYVFKKEIRITPLKYRSSSRLK
jgi:LacI family transcriptional regulator